MAQADFFQTVQKVYIAYYGRPADINGLDFWSRQLDAANGDLAQILQAFGSSAEATSLFGSGSVESKVNNIFLQLFGRQADPSGLLFYSQGVNNGTFTLVDVAQRVADGAQGSDLTTLNNKLAAATLFTQAFDTTAEILAYSGDAAASSARSFLAGVTASAATQPQVDAAVAALVAAANNTTGQTFNLTTGIDVFNGTANDDTFRARLADVARTFQSGDQLNGGGGNDTLIADVAPAAFAISAETNSVETAFFRVQTNTNDLNGNNLDGITIDAEDMVGTNTYGTVDSRSDLRIEDVRIEANQITRDITLVMRNTDPATVPAQNAVGGAATAVGAAGLEVYFDPQALRAAAPQVNGATLNVRILDQQSAANGGGPLDNDPFNGFTFVLDGTTFSIQSAAIQAATTYAQLQTAVQAAINAIPALNGRITASLGAQFTRNVGLGGTATGTTITLTDSGSGTFAIGGFLTATGTIPPNDTLAEQDTVAPVVASQLITSTILLDNVGRSSESGDLIVGSMSTRGGVEQFDLTTDRGAWITAANSTNNTLQVVNAVNTGANGYLYIGAASDRTLTNANTGSISTAAPLFVNQATLNTGAQNAGILDVRTFNAGTMTGNVKLAATITENIFTKYANLRDQAQNLASADNVPFVYTGGNGNDSFNIAISQNVFSSSISQASREDFSFQVNGGNGNDAVKILIGDGLTSTGGTAATTSNEYLNFRLLNNLSVNGGDGDDTVFQNGGFDFQMTGGNGNDVFFNDQNGGQALTINNNSGAQQLNQNSGNAGLDNTTIGGVATGTAALSKAQYILNATGQNTTNIQSGPNNQFSYQTNGNFATSKVTVTLTFRGITQTVDVPVVGNTTVGANTFSQIDNRAINQAIKAAVQTNPVLNTVMSVADGPANSLILNVEIDKRLAGGDVTTDDDDIAIAFTLVQPAAAGGNVVLTGANAATGLNVVNDYLDANAGGTTLNALDDNNVAIVGAADDVNSASDNVMDGGAGNDIYVLDTTVGADRISSSEETITFSGTAFGNDTIFNFQVDVAGGTVDAGADVLNMVALGGNVNYVLDNGTPVVNNPVGAITTAATNFTNSADAASTTDAAAAYNQLNQSISIVDLTTTAGSANLNNTAATVAAFYNGAADNAANGALTATTHVAIVVGADLSVAQVYSVTDTDGANASAALVGTIDLADVQWLALQATNFA